MECECNILWKDEISAHLWKKVYLNCLFISQLMFCLSVPCLISLLNNIASTTLYCMYVSKLQVSFMREVVKQHLWYESCTGSTINSLLSLLRLTFHHSHAWISQNYDWGKYIFWLARRDTRVPCHHIWGSPPQLSGLPSSTLLSL